MHRVLERQIIRSLGALPRADTPQEWLALVRAVSDTYTHADADRRLLERSLELSSKEFAELNKRLRSENETIEREVYLRTEELTRANAELQELDKRKSEFLSIAAHQLRTPLSGLKWALNMLIEGEIGPISNDQKVLLMKAYEGNERLINLINDMLQANRIERGVLPLKTVSTHLLDLMDNVLYEVLPNASKAGVSIRFDHRDDTLPPLMVDPEKMRAVFQNLLENAVKYSRPDGEVAISASRVGSGVQFAIIDHGIGIPADEKARIFSRFFRARNAKIKDPNGTGLGLYIVKNIIDMHGGKIWLESSEDKGTTFYFSLGV
ncbi:MAG: HAMP domain-containing sensor histidine kinase [bacterium]|nr:HAMP domain-containing sensor histidine kinase [bacterium]